MITYSLLMTVGGIAFAVGAIILIWNFLSIIKDPFEVKTKRFGLHLIAGFITSVGAIVTLAGFVWFLVSLFAQK